MLSSENQAPRGTGNPGSEPLAVGSHGETGESESRSQATCSPLPRALGNLLRAREGCGGSQERASGRRCSPQRRAESRGAQVSVVPALEPRVLVNFAVRLGSARESANLAVSASLPPWG